MRKLAKKHKMVIVVPIYEREQEGVYYNTAAVIGNDGAYLGKYRKTHIPHVAPGFLGEILFRPGNLGYPVFDVGFARRSGSTSVTTGIFRKARARWDWAGRRSFSIPRRPWRG